MTRTEATVDRWTVEQRLEQSFEGVEAVEVKLVGGEVTVVAGEGPARLVVDGVEEIPVEVELSGGTLTVTQAMPRKRRTGKGWLSFSFSLGSFKEMPRCAVELIVPAATRLEVKTVSANVAVAGLSEPVRLRTVSGHAVLKDLAERLDAKTVSGDIECAGIAGDLKVASVSGDVTVGTSSTRWVNARTVSGDVALDVDLDGTFEIASVSGSILLRVPEGEPNVTLEVATLSGRLETDWGIGWSGSGKGKIVERLGTGEAGLRLKTVSGDLRVVRRSVAA